MRNFKNECSVLINEGILVPNNGNIRFVFRHSDRFDDSIDMLELNPRALQLPEKSRNYNNK
jgi:hypothetical protein